MRFQKTLIPSLITLSILATALPACTKKKQPHQLRQKQRLLQQLQTRPQQRRQQQQRTPLNPPLQKKRQPLKL